MRNGATLSTKVGKSAVTIATLPAGHSLTSEEFWNLWDHCGALGRALTLEETHALLQLGLEPAEPEEVGNA